MYAAIHCKVNLAALATLAATASFAQSTVTLSGVMDFAYGSASGNGTTAATKLQTVSQRDYTASTSAINVAVVEDLGGGLRAEGRYEIDPRAWSNGGTNTLGRHQSFVGLSGGFGAIKLGVMNAGALNAYLASSPLGTGIGSGFATSDHTGVTTVGVVRYSNSLRYDTPRVNGFAASLTYAPGNDDAGATAAPAITNFGLTYSKGPLNVAFSNLQTSATNATVAAPKTTFNFIGANYTMGAARVFVGWGDGDKSAAVTTGSGSSAVTTFNDAKVTRVGATYTMGAVTLLGQYATTKIGTAADRKTTGLRADYALSKRTAAYLGYESSDSGAATANKINLMAVGVRHNF